jgi:hypothetical protein
MDFPQVFPNAICPTYAGIFPFRLFLLLPNAYVRPPLLPIRTAKSAKYAER